MGEFTPLRRDLLKGLGSLAMFTAFAEWAGTSMASAQSAEKPGVLNVRDFGRRAAARSMTPPPSKRRLMPRTRWVGTLSSSRAATI